MPQVDSDNGPCSDVTQTSGASLSSPVTDVTLSKNAAKKLAKRQRLESTKLARRAVERIKKKANKHAKWLERQASLDEGSTVQVKEGDKSLAETAEPLESPQPKTFFNAKLVIDCGFEELMNDREISSFVQQLLYLYSANRKAKRPFAEVIFTGTGATSCLQYLPQDQQSVIPATAQARNQTESARQSQGSIHESQIGQAMNGKLEGVWKRWKGVTIYEHGGLERLINPTSTPLEPVDAVEQEGGRISAVEKQSAGRIQMTDVVYLTADTEETLDRLEEGTTYVIGGIVDKNRYPSLCKKKADRLNIRTAKLPLTPSNLVAANHKHVDGCSSVTDAYQYTGRKVLTVNQVAEILLGWTEKGSWADALHKAVPQRKYQKPEQVSLPGESGE